MKRRSDTPKEPQGLLPFEVEEVDGEVGVTSYSGLNWCRETQPKGLPIVFAVSADMSRELRRAIEALPTTVWQEIERKGGVIRSWAEVGFIPTDGSVKKGRAPDRYLAIRLAPDQREMFSDGSEVKYFAVVTNDWGRDGAALVEWHRQKAGSIERVHRTLKNELGAGVMPCATRSARQPPPQNPGIAPLRVVANALHTPPRRKPPHPRFLK